MGGWRYAGSDYGRYRGASVLLFAHLNSTLGSDYTDIVGFLWGRTVDGRLSVLVCVAPLITGVVVPYMVYRYHRISLETISEVQSRFKSTLSDTLESIEDIISYHNEPWLWTA